MWQGLLPPGWYLLLHLLEANLITPVLLGRRFTLNPVVIFVSLIFWTWLWGVPGALLSVPILVSIKVVCDRVPACHPSANFSPVSQTASLTISSCCDSENWAQRRIRPTRSVNSGYTAPSRRCRAGRSSFATLATATLLLLLAGAASAATPMSNKPISVSTTATLLSP